VDIKNGASVIGTGQVDGTGTATVMITLAQATYSLTAAYLGNSSFQATSVSSLAYTVNAPPADLTSISSMVSPVPGTVGKPIVITVAVEDTTNTSTVPTGEVDIDNGTTVVGSGPLDSSGKAVISLMLPQGTYSLTANYLGNSIFQPTPNAPITTFKVNPPAAGATFISTFMVTPLPATAGQPMTFTATVSNGTGTAIPTGELDILKNDTEQIGSGQLDSNGNITIMLTLPAGSYNVSVRYAGNSSFNAADTPDLPITVLPASQSSSRSTTSPPQPSGPLTISRSKKGILSIGLAFDAALDPSATNIGLYQLAALVKKKGKQVTGKGVGIKNVSLSSSARSLTINLAKPFKGVVQLTVLAGLKSAGGPATTSPLVYIIH
jgi:hypothetical protein